MSTLLRQGSSPDGRMNIRQICPLGLLWLGFALGSLGVGFGFTLDWIRFDLGSIGVAFNPVCVCFGVDWVWFGCAWS